MAKIFPILKSLIRDPNRTDLIYGLAGAIQARWPGCSDRYFKRLEKLARKQKISLDSVLSLNQMALTLSELKECPPGSIGEALFKFYGQSGYMPDLYRLPLDGASDRMARLVTAYRNIHDILHVQTGLDTSVEDEMCLQAFLAGNTRSAYSSLLVWLGLVHLALYKRNSLARTTIRCFKWKRLGKNSALVLATDIRVVKLQNKFDWSKSITSASRRKQKSNVPLL